MSFLLSAIQWWSDNEPERPALEYLDKVYTYADLRHRIELAARLFKDRGVSAGDTVALLLKNSSLFLEFSLALMKLGAVCVPINYRLSATEVEVITGRSGASLLVVDSELIHLAPDRPAALEVDGRFEVQYESKLHSTLEIAGSPNALEDVFRVMYTSGTTGAPKGVIHTYENLLWKGMAHIASLKLSSEDVILVAGPLYHVGAYDLPGVSAFVVGAKLVVMREFDESRCLSLIQSAGVTGVWMAPVMLGRCLNNFEPGAYDVSSLKWVIGGGERTPVERIHRFKSLFTSARYIDAYGLTETSSGDTMMPSGMELEKIGSTGLPVPYAEVSIQSEDGVLLAADEVGEICVAGKKVTIGYWNDAKTTNESFRGRWFRTGDLGYLDADGYLYLTDRKKDIIISGGENISSIEVENVVYQMPEVAEVAALGLPDEAWGERVTVVVVLKQGVALTEADIRAHCGNHLARYKVPKSVIFHEALPRNPSGKILKRELRAQLQPLSTN